jgi:chaperonin GroES
LRRKVNPRLDRRGVATAGQHLERANEGSQHPQQRKEPAMAKLKIRPLGDKVLVKRLEAEERTAGGIVLPDAAREKPKRGKVQAVGDGKILDSGERSKLQVSKGDEVLFSSYAGTEIKVNGEELLILDENDILAIID